VDRISREKEELARNYNGKQINHCIAEHTNTNPYKLIVL
jgi:hypothetical protein